LSAGLHVSDDIRERCALHGRGGRSNAQATRASLEATGFAVVASILHEDADFVAIEAMMHALQVGAQAGQHCAMAHATHTCTCESVT
jgi:hypothetical protein